MYEPDDLLEMLYEERMAPTLHLDDDEYELFATNEEDDEENDHVREL